MSVKGVGKVHLTHDLIKKGVFAHFLFETRFPTIGNLCPSIGLEISSDSHSCSTDSHKQWRPIEW